MPTAYTPGLKITEDTLVIKERRLPIKGEVLVKVGDPTQPDTVVARAMLEGNLHTFKAAEQLNLSPAELIGALKKQIGDEIAKDEILAETKGLFGLFHSVLRAPVAGVIEHIGKTSGFIGIRQPPQPIETHAYLRGKVTEILEGEGAIIETRAAFVQGIFGVGGERRGMLRMAARGPDEPLDPTTLGERARGAVLVGGAMADSQSLSAAARAGAAGVVVGGVADVDLRTFVGYDIGVAVTGQEAVPFTLILTEGFGRVAMLRRTFELLASLEERQAAINGATQIRAGVIRPEIIVALGAPPADDAHESPPRAAEREGQLAVGAQVRIIREPYFGRLAAVVALPAEPRQIDTEARVRVVELDLGGGRRVMVPRANVEMVHG